MVGIIFPCYSKLFLEFSNNLTETKFIFKTLKSYSRMQLPTYLDNLELETKNYRKFIINL